MTYVALTVAVLALVAAVAQHVQLRVEDRRQRRRLAEVVNSHAEAYERRRQALERPS